MSEPIKRVSHKTGFSPGSLVHIGEKKTEHVKIHIIDYSPDSLQEIDAQKIEETFPFKDKTTISWIDITGLHDKNIMEKIGENFDIHSLVLEDILNTEHRPKIEEFETRLFITLKMISFDEKKKKLLFEQVSLLLGPNFVISFQEKEGDVFDPLRERIRKEKSRTRAMGADYLGYALIDVIVDHYFLVLEKIGEKIEKLEEELMREPKQKTLKEIYAMKRELISLRKAVWPLREVISRIERTEHTIIKKKTGIYFRDLYDHIIQIIDTIETSREMVSGMVELYLSSLSNRMNEVMKTLTIIATIFIPLTFIAGVYGMNFKFMPELEWPLGYYTIGIVMLIVAGTLVVYFKRKKWI
ncbi:magnesium/cobalt transporter CorA [Candidatus Micrarchaeota archaeon]|nr:magnesium/cobalt transporter CorA [Candidatus Micrarchaeota archaeon]